jgi:hypothetical protein|tara:strand:+ start:218 stop:841 length:624 start_codon:yes stop_codon:yes gene_type:complete
MDDFKTATITEKLNFIQHELKVKKSNVNSFAKFNYRTLDDIFENVKPLLDKTGCVITISDELVDKNNGTYIKATVELSDGNDSISVDAFARESVGKKGMDDPQMTGTASTYARKYACNGLFAIDDTEDSDSMDNREQTLLNGKKPTKGHITVDQNLKLDRLSRDPALKGTDTPAKVRKLIDENPTEDRAAKAIVKLQNAIKKAKEAK